MSEQLASDWDHRIIDGVSIAMDGRIGLSTDHKRLREQIEQGPSNDKLKVAVEIAVAFMRYAQDLKSNARQTHSTID